VDVPTDVQKEEKSRTEITLRPTDSKEIMFPAKKKQHGALSFYIKVVTRKVQPLPVTLDAKSSHVQFANFRYLLPNITYFRN